MNSKAFILLGLLFAAVVLEVTAVTAGDDIKSSESNTSLDDTLQCTLNLLILVSLVLYIF